MEINRKEKNRNNQGGRSERIGAMYEMKTHHCVRPEQNVFLRRRPRVLADGRVELVVPPLTALLARAAVERRADDAPVLRTVRLDL